MSHLHPEVATEETTLAHSLDLLLQQAVEQQQADRLLEAERLYRAVLAERPDHPDANHHLGVVIIALSGPAAALPYFQAAIQADPTQGQYWLSCVDALIQAAQMDAARRILELGIRAGLHGNKVQALQSRLQNTGTTGANHLATKVDAIADPASIEATYNLGRSLLQEGDLAQAEACFRRAIELCPSLGEAHASLGDTFARRYRHAEAEACFRRVLELQPNLAAAHNNLAIVLNRQARPEESEASCRRAIACNPELAEAHSNLGAALTDQGRLTEAAASYRQALALQPELAVAHRGLLFCLNHGGEIEPQALFAEHIRFADRFETPLLPAWPRHQNSRDPDRPLRVGFVSGDLRTHAMAHFIEPLLAQLSHDPGLVLHAYSNHPAEDRVTYRLRERIPHWHRIFALSDAALAEKIQADAIDILVDLTGYTAHSRLLTFARKPAPIQCGWIGYLGTSGLRSIDYYLADRHFLPPGQFEPYFTETIVHLPIVSPFEPSPDAPPIHPLPALTSGHLTFGSFSRRSKLSQPVIALWAQLLRALPDSRMLLAGMPRDTDHKSLTRWFTDAGIDAQRLHFHHRCSDQKYLELHHQVDLALDPFPFTGATTTSNALWMGVPTLTLTGPTAASRLGPALLHHAGLADFVAHSPQDFLDKGLFWASNLDALAKLRSGMRERFLSHPIGQPAAAAQGLSSAFRTMWHAWCAATPEAPPSIPFKRGH